MSPADVSHLLGLSTLNKDFIDGLLKRFQENPSAVPADWHGLLRDLVSAPEPAPRWAPKGEGAPPESGPRQASPKSSISFPGDVALSSRAQDLLTLYRTWGHRKARLDPLGLVERETPPGLPWPVVTAEEAESPAVGVSGFEGRSVGDFLAHLERCYCGSLTLESAAMEPGEAQDWLRHTFEAWPDAILSADDRKELLSGVLEAEAFEAFLGIKFVGAKRFGLDGGEGLIPVLRRAFQKAQKDGVKTIILGMAHRGRLNVMATVMGLPLPWIFRQFQGLSLFPEGTPGSGDVKYHLGARSNGIILLPNPSHLEVVNPLVMGYVKARQDADLIHDPRTILGVLIHGDAAFAGQGIVAECLTFQDLSGYTTHGTLHVIINNQVGFTANPEDARSTVYPSDSVKGAGIPVLHVNGDDLEAADQAFQIALAFHERFGRDIVIDFWCYRRNGHNETDEPTFTQPQMYRAIHAHPSPGTLYQASLERREQFPKGEIAFVTEAIHRRLLEAFEQTPAFTPPPLPPIPSPEGPETGVSLERLQEIGATLTTVPPGFHLHPKLVRFLDGRRGMTRGEKPVDWSFAEALAFGALLKDGIPVRLSGQDSIRGTFTSRHGFFYDQETGVPYNPFEALGQTRAALLNSPLSEVAVLGFEFGYTWGDPETLTLWEAQFGDFANGAQVMIDQYLSSAETKWRETSGLVLLLPHGQEGQGPEHSSARLERFLQLCAEDNMRVVNCTTPANYFHILRAQAKTPLKKPLIVMSPKSLLRHPKVVSPLADFAPGSSFQPVMGESSPVPPKPGRVVLCSGKVFYDLLAQRDALQAPVPILRLERLYPFPEQELRSCLAPYGGAQASLVWAQEEAYNYGAWSFVRERLEGLVPELGFQELVYAGRPAAAAPATGYGARHGQEQAQLIADALGV